MSELPATWQEVEIIEVLAPNDNGKPFQQGWSPQCERFPAAEGAWGVLKTTAIQHGEYRPHENKALPDHLEPRAQIEVQAGDVVMTCAGPRNRCGVACLVEHTRPRLMLSGKMYRFRPHPDGIAPKYLAYLIQRHETQLEIDRMKTGINDSGLNLTHDRFAALRVPLAPLHEQRRIVTKIEELFAELDKAVESLTLARAQLKTYRQALLKSAFEGRLTGAWRAANPDKLEPPQNLLARIRTEREARYMQAIAEWQPAHSEWRAGGEVGRKPAKPRRTEDQWSQEGEFSDLHLLPSCWSWHVLAETSDHIVDGTHKTPTYQQEGVPFISAKDINGFRVSFSNTRFISQEEHEELSRRCNVRRDCVLITKSGTIGRVAVVETDDEFSLFESVANVPVSRVMNPRYVALAASHFIETYFGAAQQKGVAVRHLHLEDLRRLPIPICSRAEQDAIVEQVDAAFSSIGATEHEIDITLAKTNALRQSILKQAFSGQLVAQDPADEPAAALLARLRDKVPPTRTRRRKTS